MTPRVSIVIPTWNRRDLLVECLRSLEAQSFREFETIVVDDGSTDDTVEVIERDFPSVRLARLLENQRFCTAVNAGLRVAMCEYVMPLNNDMTLEADFLENLVTAADASDAALFAPLVLLLQLLVMVPFARTMKIPVTRSSFRRVEEPEVPDDAWIYFRETASLNLHTNSAGRTIDRIVEVFPDDQQEAVRAMLAGSLQGVLSQLLCARVDVEGRHPATELLFTSMALRSVIREGAAHKIESMLQAEEFATIHMGSSRYFVPNQLEAPPGSQPEPVTPAELQGLGSGIERHRSVRVA